MANRKHYRIVLDNPPTNRGRPRGSGPIQRYLKRLGDRHPNEWALFRTDMKSPSSLRRFAKEFPGFEMTTKRNSDGTYRVWLRIVKPVPGTSVINFTDDTARRTQYVVDPRNFTNTAEVPVRDVIVANADGQLSFISVQTEED